MNHAESGKEVGSVLLGDVVQTFFFEDGSLVLVVDVESPPVTINPDDFVQIRWPGGRALQTRLQRVELTGVKSRATIGLVLPKELHALQVPVGARVWRAS